MKGLIHFHSNCSNDAVLTLEKIKKLALKHNIDFICMTEHDSDIKNYEKYKTHCKKLSDKNFKFIPGIEFCINKDHFILINAEKKNTPLKQITKNKILILAHPKTPKIPEQIIKKLDGAEIWNTHVDSRFVPNKKKIKIFKKLKKNNPKLKAFTAIDFHNNNHFKPTYIITKSNNIIKDLKSGNFYTLDKRVIIPSNGNINFKLSFYLFNIFYSLMKGIGKINQVLKLRIPYKIKKSFYRFY